MPLQIVLILSGPIGCHVWSAIVVEMGDNVGLLFILIATDDSKSVGYWKGPRKKLSVNPK